MRMFLNNAKNKTASLSYKAYLVFLIIFTLICATQIAIASPSNLKEKNAIKMEIEKIINETDPDVNLGVMVRNLDQDKLLYSLNENRINCASLPFVITKFYGVCFL